MLVVSFLKKILLVIECFCAILYFNYEKVLLVTVIALDQFFKAKIVSNMIPGESFPVIQDIFHITYVLNPGAAFGILPNQRVFFLVAGSILILLAAYFYPKLRKSDRTLKFGGALLLSGAISNSIDRIQIGKVVDFFDFRIWAIFNIADIAIVIGTVIVIYAVLFKMDETGDIKGVE